MDATDVLIFCEMGFKYTDYSASTERRISPSEIGRKLHLDEKTVRLRVKRMEDEGFIKYYQVIPNLGLFGLGYTVVYGFEANDVPSKQEAIEALQRQPRVVEILDLLGPGFSVTLAGSSDDEVQAMARRVASELKLKRLFKITDRRMVAPTASLARLDWQILEACRYDALCPANEIAEKLSVTPRIVEYRLTKLLESRGCFIKAMINVQNQKGVIFYNLALLCDEAKTSAVARKLKDAHGQRLWSAVEVRPLKALVMPLTMRDKLIFVLARGSWIVAGSLFAETPAEPEASLTEALKLEGVKRGFMSIMKEWIEPRRPTWIDELLQTKITPDT